MKKFALLFFLMIVSLLIVPASAQELPDFSDLPIGEWTRIEVPDGICLYGEDYSFFARPNENPASKLLIYFQGGGACWDGLTCGSVGEFATFYDVSDATIASYNQGIFDFDNPDNPLADYDVVFMPYCTGDVHTGDNEATFTLPPELEAETDELDVYFKGHHNAQLVMDWVYENFADPQHIVITGCSAGGYGAVSQAPFIMEHYADAPAVMLADSSHGILPSGWEGLVTWGTVNNFPDFIPAFAELSREDYNTSIHVELMAEHFPNNQFAQFNSYLDGVQIGFYGSLQGYDLSFENEIITVAAQWSARMLANIQNLSGLENFSYYTSGGFQHCVVSTSVFYEFDQSGVLVSEWLADVIAGTADNVACSILAQDCFVSPLED